MFEHEQAEGAGDQCDAACGAQYDGKACVSVGGAEGEDVVAEGGGCGGREAEAEAVEREVMEPAAGLRLLGGGVSTATSIAATAVEI